MQKINLKGGILYTKNEQKNDNPVSDLLKKGGITQVDISDFAIVGIVYWL